MVDQTRVTDNLSFAAFAYMRGLRIRKGAEQRSRGGVSYRFTFDDPSTAEFPGGRWDDLCIEFANSESALYDNAVRQLKLLCKNSS